MQSSSVNPMGVRLSGRIAEEHVDTLREVIGWEKGRAALDNTFSYGNDLKQADAHQPPKSIVRNAFRMVFANRGVWNSKCNSQHESQEIRSFPMLQRFIHLLP